MPTGEHLSLTTGNAGGTKLVRNGVASPPLGATGAVLHNVPLGGAASAPVPLQTAELLPHPKPAQAAPRPTQVAAAPSRAAAEAAPATGVARPVDAGVGGGKLVHPPAPASIMLVANSKIAHVEPASPTRLATVAPVGQDPASLAVLATADTWVQVQNSTGAVVFSQVLHAGQTWRVPAGEHLSLTTGNAGGTKLVRNGVASPPLGATGAVLHNVPLGGAASAPVPLQTAELLPHPKPAQVVPRPTQVAAAPSRPPPSRPAAEAAPAAGVTRPIAVGIGGGILVHLPGPASTVLAADPKIARVEPASPTSLFVIGVARGTTSVIATNQAGEAVAQYVVRVSGRVAPEALGARRTGGAGGSVVLHVQSAINRIVPGAGSVQVRKVGAAYVLSGAVATPAIAQQVEAIARAFAGKDPQLINQMTVLSSIEVNVRVRVAEISRTMVRQLGLNWQALGKASTWRFGLLTGAAATAPISALLPLGLTPSAAGQAFQLGAGVTSGHWNIDNVIDALAANQLATILAEPNLTVESGNLARFLSGGEYPVPVPSSGSNSISIQYKQYGVSLSVVPTVIAPDRISLKVMPSVSQLTTTGAISVPIQGGSITVPALLVRRAQTVVELGSGEAFAIAGLLQTTTSQQTNGLPGASDIPVLGGLFNTNQFQRTADELVIIVTPYLVNPVPTPDALHAPTDHFAPATDLEQILFGKQMETGPGPRHAAPLDAGFLME